MIWGFPTRTPALSSLVNIVNIVNIVSENIGPEIDCTPKLSGGEAHLAKTIP